MKNKKPAWLRVGIPASLITALVTLLVANLGDQQKDIDYRIENVASVDTPEFHRNMENLLGPSIVSGNRISVLQNGDEIFPAMLGAIRSAKETINFESYIYIDGQIGDQFVKALAERARAQVKVHLLVDWAGSHLSKEHREGLNQAGVEVRWYHPLAWYSMTRMNNRTHRKLLIIDGKTGFTGGVGISDFWAGNADSKDHWRDSHFKVEGPVVGQLQAAFTDNWVATSENVLHGDLYFPKIEKLGPSFAQVFKSAPREGAASSQLMYLIALGAAKKEILLQNAYFVPGPLAIRALLDARKRGVRVRIIVPGKITDSDAARYASRHTWGELPKQGVEIYVYQPTMYHVKVMMIDGEMVSVGSTNFDDRSFRLNSEANLNIFDRDFAAQMAAAFEKDVAQSKKVSFEDWQNRPKLEKFFGFAASLISNQL